MALQGKSVLEKAATLLAVTLGIAVGLCGINYAVYRTPFETKIENSLVISALIESGIILLSAAGLLIVLLILLSQKIFQHFSSSADKPND